MTTGANDTPTNATEELAAGADALNNLLERATRVAERAQDNSDKLVAICKSQDAEITELRAQLNRVIESSSIAESARLNAEAEALRLRTRIGLRCPACIARHEAEDAPKE